MSVNQEEWNEATPDDGDFISEGDDNIRAVKIGIRSRMSAEHGWPASQVATNQAGYHTAITLSGQAAAPGLVYGTASTQLAGIWCSSGSAQILLVDSAGNSYPLLTPNKGITVISAVYSATGTLGEMVIGSSGGQLAILSPGLDGQILTASTAGTGVYWSSNGAKFASITNYSGNSSTGTSVDPTTFRMYYGKISVPNKGTQVISGLAFANATSYFGYASQVTGSGALPTVVGPSLVQPIDGANCRVLNASDTTIDINWQLIGI